MKLQGKVAIVTGAGRGLGRASAVAMARAGADLVVVSRTPHELEETAALIIEGGGTVVALEADLANPADIGRIVETAVETFGGIDILMNNAAIIGLMKPCHEIPEEEWRYALAVDLHAPILLSRRVVPFMIKQGGGKIINVTSGLGEIALSPFGAYSVSKAGLMHLTRIMAAELRKHNIQVNGLDPGVMDSRMQEEIRNAGAAVLGAELHRHFVGYYENGVLRPPANVARLALFLAYPESDGITGVIGGVEEYKRFGYRGD
jgi:NAD(P)-dependent dehydrogenase (short-subunit alcohol dehydrogenase family)